MTAIRSLRQWIGGMASAIGDWANPDRYVTHWANITDDDDMCPNCVTPWKCNGPHDYSENDD